MATKFKIFCDEGQQGDTQQPEKRLVAPAANLITAAAHKLAEIKREPLGLRQTASQAIPAQQTTQTNAGPSLLINPNNQNDDEDQENDISMASLGSDFVPSILNDEVEDEEYDGEEDVDDHHFEDNSFEIEEDDDYEADKELQLELSRAFKTHDESQLFKSTIYIDDIKLYLTNLERETDLRPQPNYMDFQDEIDSTKRTILINWLVEVSEEYDLQAETLFIATSIIDRFLSKMSIKTCNFQLLGVAAMFIASKYEEIYPPNLYQFIEITDDTFSGQQIRQMEQEILMTLDFRITMPTVSYFLRQIFAYNKFSKKVYDLAEYLCHLALIADQPFLEHYPSEIALAAVILAAKQLDATDSISYDLRIAYDKSNIDQLNRRNLPNNTKLSDVDRRRYIVNQNLPFCIEALLAIQKQAFSKSSKILVDAAVINKFSTVLHNCVALLTPLKDEDLLLFHNG